VKAFAVVVSTLLLVLALLVQRTLIGRLNFPLGRPDLVVVTLVCIAVVQGPMWGASFGFAIGLLADLLSDHTLGRLALVFCLVGYAAGLLSREVERSVLVPLATAAAACGAAVGMFALFGALLGDGQVAPADVAGRAVSVAVYALVLTPLLFPVIAALLRRLDPFRAERR
jgi:rod shape-determining protein MreD